MTQAPEAAGLPVRVALSNDQRVAIARGRFVRVDLGRVVETQGVETRTALVGRSGGRWRAFANVCRHQAVPLDLGADSPMGDDGHHLVCHQHGAVYRPSDGWCVSGPCAGESLAAIDVEEADGDLVLGKRVS